MTDRAAFLAVTAVVLLIVFIGAGYQIVYNLFSWVVALALGAVGLFLVYAVFDAVKTPSAKTAAEPSDFNFRQ